VLVLHVLTVFIFQGEKNVFKGPVVLSEAPGLVTAEDPATYPDGFRSYMCDCDMNYINCVPTDNFEVVLYCDASSASVSFFHIYPELKLVSGLRS
jgi:hypothetical protein